jgi:hypothetical protein
MSDNKTNYQNFYEFYAKVPVVCLLVGNVERPNPYFSAEVYNILGLSDENYIDIDVKYDEQDADDKEKLKTIFV